MQAVRFIETLQAASVGVVEGVAIFGFDWFMLQVQ